ncbi:hypothetical protein AK812_SmicGene27002 [Symbiodinium microadriaticum]|uniref:Uncharacterized protein n=1 Tax=Symbiodinium microadriaticum TaxID=2951 RepID=A0A1Q9D834_SYMMI|nr:hypothetical protein AK812_SmicGene27002 [Symbiodinium microadriaticum]
MKFALAMFALRKTSQRMLAILLLPYCAQLRGDCGGCWLGWSVLLAYMDPKGMMARKVLSTRGAGAAHTQDLGDLCQVECSGLRFNKLAKLLEYYIPPLVNLQRLQCSKMVPSEINTFSRLLQELPKGRGHVETNHQILIAFMCNMCWASSYHSKLPMDLRDQSFGTDSVQTHGGEAMFGDGPDAGLPQQQATALTDALAHAGGKASNARPLCAPAALESQGAD